MDFHWSEIAFGLIVRHPDVEVVHESEDRSTVRFERDDEVVGVALQAVAFPTRGRVGVGGVAIGDQVVVTGGEFTLPGWGERSVSIGSGLVTGSIDLYEQPGETGRPRSLGGDLGDRGQIAEQMRVMRKSA